MRFGYVVWFRNPQAAADDPDDEWPACFLIHADDAESAQRWGDHISRRYAERVGEIFLSSGVEFSVPGEDPSWDAQPELREGEEASDDHIGW